MKRFYTVLFLFLIVCILTNSQLSLAYALMGLQLWFEKMIPALFPFMIVSGIMIRMNLTDGFSKLLYPVIRPLYQISPNACYAMIIGFLCGFPMGAKTVSDLVKRNMLSRTEAELLLAFCNNIGPVYFCSFVLPLLGRELVFPYVLGMYGIPLLYGFILRHTFYKSKLSVPDRFSLQMTPSHSTELKILNEVDDAINSSIQSILSLGGYMILFNLMNLIPHVIFGKTPIRLAPLFEITGGLKLSEGQFPLYAFILLSFGGLSCMAQTYHCIQGTNLSISRYLIHKLVLTLLTILYYLSWFLLFPDSFLR